MLKIIFRQLIKKLIKFNQHHPSLLPLSRFIQLDNERK